MTADQYKLIREMTRRQADTLQLNEHEYIKLMHINKAVLLKEWESMNRKYAKRKEERIEL